MVLEELEAELNSLSEDMKNLEKRISNIEGRRDRSAGARELGREIEEAVRLRLYGFKRDHDGQVIEFETDEATERIRESLYSYRRSAPKGEIAAPSLSAEMQTEIEEEYREGFSPETNYEMNRLKREAIERKLQERQAALEMAIRAKLYGPTTARGPLQIIYQGEIQSFFEHDGRRFAKVFLIDSTMNKAGWGVTPEATRKALASLRELALFGPPERAHQPGAYKVGEFRSYESNGVTYGLFEITNEQAWKKIQSREWRHVSPKITAHEVEKLPNGQDLITNYSFDHLAFCNYPAYSQPADGVIAIYG